MIKTEEYTLDELIHITPTIKDFTVELRKNANSLTKKSASYTTLHKVMRIPSQFATLHNDHS